MILNKELIEVILNSEKKSLDNYSEFKGSYTGTIIAQERTKLISFSEFKDCFFSEKSCYAFHFSGKHFQRCIIAIPYTHSIFYEMLKNNTFDNCVIFIDEIQLSEFRLGFYEKEFSRITQNNTLIDNSLITTLCSQFGNDLSQCPVQLTRGLLLQQKDLTNIQLPNHKNFFNDLLYRTIYSCKLPNIDYSIYNLSNVTFSNVEFHDDSTFSNNFIYSNFTSCILPPIDFSKIEYSKLKPLKYFNCEFAQETIFPEDKYFFQNNNILSAILPSQDYSNYNIDKYMLAQYTFTNESKIPKEYLTYRNLKHILKMKNIPTEYLKNCVRFAPIKFPNDFIQKYNDRLSNEDIFILSRRYNINNFNS